MTSACSLKDNPGKSHGLLRQGQRTDPVAAFRFIAAEKANHSVEAMCRVLGVSRAGFYAWETRAPCERELQDAWLNEKIRQIHTESKATYGARRIHADPRLEHGILVGRKRVERLMALAGLQGVHRPRRGRTTVSLKDVRVAPDLVERDFNPSGPDQTWAADITEIPTWEGKLYLAHVQDLFSRRIVGSAMAGHMRKELVADALEMAVGRRNPDAGIVHHSDHGSQYTALLFSARCEQAGISLSTGSIDDCYDNAVCEAFHASLKKELIHRRPWRTRAEARTAIFEYIELSPAAKESDAKPLSKAERHTLAS